MRITDQPAEPAPPVAVVADRYRLGERIGRGGRSVVHAAEDPLLQREVAVKIFTSSAGDPADLALQQGEARRIAGMNHYALTTLLDAGVDTTDPANPRIFLVMERIPGVDLRRHIDDHGPLSPAQVSYLGFDLAEGLQSVHEHGLLHRDIKPANVLIADRRLDTRIRGKLTDFGISSLIGVPDPGEGTSGTAAYLSPEQVDGQEPTTASDVYALGLVLLEALTGDVAYPGGVMESAFARLDHDAVIPATVPAALSGVLRRMVSLLPEDRPALAEVALEFQRAFVQDLVDAGRVSPAVLASAEQERLAAVQRYGILDTPPDDAFDRITQLACRLLDVPVAFLSIVDADREWFKSRRGLEVEQIDRDAALCATTVATGRPLAIEDVQVDPALAANPLVLADPTLRAFASVPLSTRDGHAIGTLCVFDRRPRVFTADELDDLAQLAAIAVRELDLRLASRRALFSA